MSSPNSVVKTNGALDALDLDQLRAEYRALGVEYERLETRLKRAIDDRPADVIRKEIEELNRKVGQLTVSTEFERTAKEKLAGEVAALREKHAGELALLRQDNTAKSETIRELRAGKTLAESVLNRFTAAKAGNAWGPWIGAAALVAIVLYFWSHGYVMLKTGNDKQDELALMGTVQQMMYQHRDRDVELQKPQKVWGSKKVWTADEKGIVSLEIYGVATSAETKPDLDFAVGCILSAFRCRTGISMESPDGTFFLRVLADRSDIIQFPEQMNALVGKHVCEMMAEKKLEFNFSVQIENVGAKDENHRRVGIGGMFKDGRFQNGNIGLPQGKG